MVAIVDGNTFYASVEKVFNPKLEHTPVVVMSNNDGIIIAQCKLAKAVGLKRGDAVFEKEELIRKHGVKVFSANFVLYGNMSARMKTILSWFTPEVEDYSIDESFMDLSGFMHLDLHDYGRQIVEAVRIGTGLPVSIGVSPTKTLSKVANKFAKKYDGYKSVCVIDTDDKRIIALKKTDISDLWGIGRRYERKLRTMGINTAYEFTQLPRAWVRKHMTVVGERMWRELYGDPCIEMELIPPKRKEIMTSRSFGHRLTAFDAVAEALSNYAAVSAAKLRRQGSCAKVVTVFLLTDRFKDNLPQYNNTISLKMPVASQSDIQIIKTAVDGLKRIYRKGYEYKKVGIILSDIVDQDKVQGNLFDTVDHTVLGTVTNLMDKLNARYGRNAVRVAALGTDDKEWKMRQEKLSPCYTTRITDILQIK